MTLKISFSKLSCVLLLYAIIPLKLTAQADMSNEELQNSKEKIEQLVSFLEFTLNTIGSSDTPTKEKEIIINQSYLKIFEDEEVQIEDDLDDNREVVTNKDVQAYLKDIDFFFQHVSFELMVEDISHFVNDDGQIYFLVSLTRHLLGTTLNGDTINSIRPRFIEINFHDASQGLKIVSIYTTKLSEKEELLNWWQSLSFEWQSVLKRQLGIYDTVGVVQLKDIIELTSLDISGNQYIDELNGINKLKDLQILDISNTRVKDLVPLRNLTNLTSLRCNYTEVSNLSPLRYSYNLQEILARHTNIQNIEVLADFEKIKQLNLAYTKITSIDPIANHKSLQSLNIAGTKVVGIDAVASLTNLTYLNIANTPVFDLHHVENDHLLEVINISGTKIKDLKSLQPLINLKIILCNNTPISSLDPVNELPKLERIYCDGTLITKVQANQFMKFHPDILVIFKSEVLLNWWQELPVEWKQIFKNHVKIDSFPKKEQLAQVAQINEIVISGKGHIDNLAPLSVLENLKSLKANNTSINSLEPLRELEDLEYLDVRNTLVDDLGPLSFSRELKILKIESTRVDNLLPIIYHNGLKFLYCDNISVPKGKIESFADKNRDCLVIYRTKELQSWWNLLEPNWKNIFKKHLSAVFTHNEYRSDTNNMMPGKEDLHKIVNLRVINIQFNHAITEVEPLTMLTKLRNLQITGTRIGDISPLAQLNQLQSIDLSENPLSSLADLEYLPKVRYLNIENTPIEDLDPIQNWQELEELNCAGTPIKNLKPLQDINKVKIINCANTDVRNLKHIEHLPIKKLIVFNTRVSSSRIEDFIEEHPDAEVMYY